MSYNDDQVRTKFNILTDTQESIEQVGQWVLFHRRHAPRTVALWAQHIKDSSPSKRLNLIYLANEVIQQSRIKKKDDFPDAFAPLIADSLGTAYSSATKEVQGKLRRVVDVWRQRSIFDGPTIERIEARFNEVDKTRGAKRSTLGGSLAAASSSGGVPSELSTVANLQTQSSKAAISATDSAQAATQAYNATPKDAGATPLPAYSATLSKTLKSLDAAAAAVQASISARESLVAQMQSVLDTNKATLLRERGLADDMAAKRADVASRKTGAEDAIMRGGGGSVANGNGGAYANDDDDAAVPRPEIEAITPPPIEAFTPPPDDPAAAAAGEPSYMEAMGLTVDAPPDDTDGAATPPGDPSPYARSFSSVSVPPLAPPALFPPSTATATAEGAGMGAGGGDPRRAKRRRLDGAGADEEAFAGDGLEGLDADVVGMLG